MLSDKFKQPWPITNEPGLLFMLTFILCVEFSLFPTNYLAWVTTREIFEKSGNKYGCSGCDFPSLPGNWCNLKWNLIQTS